MAAADNEAPSLHRTIDITIVSFAQKQNLRLFTNSTVNNLLTEYYPQIL